MDCVANIEKLAITKLIEATCLFDNEHYDWAYYTAGYTIELLLKAKVCSVLGIEDFFDEKNGILKKLKFPQTFKNHDLEQLLILSGIYKEFGKDCSEDINLRTKWSSICSWNEGSRYLMGKAQLEVQDFLTSISEIAAWIQKHS